LFKIDEILFVFGESTTGKLSFAEIAEEKKMRME